MADFDPMTPVAGSPLPQSAVDAIFGDATTETVIDMDQIDELLGFPPDAPAASLSADELAEMRALLTRWRSIAADDTARVSVSAHRLLSSDMPRLLSALEALTAENAKLRSDLSHYHIRANQEYDRAQKAEAEVRRLTARAATLEAEAEAAIGVLTNSLMCGFDHRRATVKELQERISGANDILARAVYGQPQDWYAFHRSRVEAAHAAAKEAALPRALSELRAVWPAPSAEMQAIADDMRGEDGL